MSENSTSVCTIILIILIILLIIFIIAPLVGKITYHKIDFHWFKGNTLLEIYNISKNIKNGLNTTTIDSKKLPISTNGIEYSFNFWIYIDNWDYRNFEKKVILNWTDKNNNGFTFTISDLLFGVIIKQDLSFNNNIDYKLAYTGTEYVNLQNNCGTDQDCGTINPGQSNTFMGIQSTIAKEYNGVINTNNYKDVPELPLQKWMHFVVNLEDDKLDLFVNNKLYISKRLQFVPNVSENKLVICENGGFDGYINRLEYYDRSLTLDEIRYKFDRGPVTHNFFKQIIGWMRTDKGVKSILPTIHLNMSIES